MSSTTTAIVLILALAADAAFGYPEALFRIIGHPVTWMGRVMSWLDQTYNKADLSEESRKLAGVSALGLLLASVAIPAWLVQHWLSASWLGLALLALATSTMLASRSLKNHVSTVAEALQSGDIVEARRAVAKIVGRDPELLDEHGIARAATESLAENASDGVVAPAFWFLVLGLPGLALYKAINTADSMVGHRTPKHEAFGWAFARLDDIVNWPAARLTGLIYAAAATQVPGASPARALSAMLRDAKHHRSPNAGWPESALAGALGYKLAGPRSYGGQMTEDGYMGDGNADLTADDVWRALSLSEVAWAVLAGAVAVYGLIALF